MSLDITLTTPRVGPEGSGVWVRDSTAGFVKREVTREEWDRAFPGLEPVHYQEEDSCLREEFTANLTHNLTRMADEAGLYKALWRPEEIRATFGRDLVNDLQGGLDLLRAEPERFKALNPANGWGSYENLVKVVADYLAACRAHPDAVVRVSR